MKVLILWAQRSSTNLGVRALAEGTGALVHRVWPDAELVFQNWGDVSVPLPVGNVRSQVRERVTGRRGSVDWLRQFDLVVDTRSGDSFADIYGMWRLTIMSGVSDLVSRAGVPLVLGPQTIGPFDSRRGRRVASRTLRSAALVMARDTASARCAEELGRPVDVLTSDVVFAIDVPDREPTYDVLLNVSGLLWNPNRLVDHEMYRVTVRTVAEQLQAAGRRVTLLAHVLDSAYADNDVPAVQELAALTPGVDVAVPTDLDDVRRMVAGAEVVVGSRMHACLNALSCGTPAVPLAYSRKFESLLADLGWVDVVDLRTEPDAVGAVVAKALAPDLRARVAPVLANAHASLATAQDALRGLV